MFLKATGGIGEALDVMERGGGGLGECQSEGGEERSEALSDGQSRRTGRGGGRWETGKRWGEGGLERESEGLLRLYKTVENDEQCKEKDGSPPEGKGVNRYDEGKGIYRQLDWRKRRLEGFCYHRFVYLSSVVFSKDEAYNLYQEHAFKMGFSVRRGRALYYDSEKKNIRLKDYYCSKQGFKNNEPQGEVTYERADSRTNCQAMVRFNVSKEGLWKITKLELNHNHDFVPPEQTWLQTT
ncbi:FAR1 DNA-binding domain [Sesbania bispinosa]|nr:FAR1 DNA-binding domain [Sesbania bispinosa]